MHACPGLPSFRVSIAGDPFPVPSFLTSILLLLLWTPNSHPNAQTFPEFFQIQIRGFLAAVSDGFETSV